MNDLQLPVWIMLAHWFADFVCQTDWMAQNKSKNWRALLMHVSVYTTVLVGVINWVFLFSPTPWFITRYISWFCVTFVTHFVTDAITSRINTRLWQEKQVHWFFVSVGFDQFIHYITLALTLQYLGG